MISTPTGDVAIEDLKTGDLVLTAQGRAEKVRWIGRRTVVKRFVDPITVLPVTILAGAIDENVPARDLTLSPCHAVLIDGVLVQAGALVNGHTVVRMQNVPDTFTYFHVELADHTLILAEGVASETFVDNVDRMVFDNWSEHEEIASNFDPIAEMDLPRAKSQRQVPRTIRARMAARTAGFGITEAG